MKKSAFATIIALSAVLTLGAQTLVGDWTGTLEVSPSKSLRLVIHVSDSSSVTLDSPMQGVYGIETKVLYISADSLNFRVPKLNVRYAGRVVDGKLSGTFKQGLMKFPLVFEPGEKKARRPQTPQPPFPYLSENVTVTHGDVTLAGTLTVPENASGDTPVVVMVTGSGLQNRDEEVLEHKPFAVIADHLARNGIASLRYDDRGFGESVGDASKATTADFADDALSVVNWLKTNKKFGKIGLLGHSEGGIIAFMLGARPSTLDFLVSIAGPAVRGDSILLFQNMNALARSGIEEIVAEDFKIALQKAFQLKIDKPDIAVTDALLTEIYPSRNECETTRRLTEGIRAMLADKSNLWMQFFLSHSPSGNIASLHIPSLLIYGEKDMQVPASLNAEAARRLAPAADVRVYQGLNHLMQNAVSGNIEEYGEIEETISPQVLTDIVTFIKSARRAR